MSAHESMEHAEHAEHASGSNKKIALLIAVIALLSGAVGDAGQGRADRIHQQERRGLEPLGVLPGQEHPPHRGADRGRAGQAQPRRRRATMPPRRRCKSRSTTGRRPRRATAPSRKPAKAPSSLPSAPSMPSTSATSRWRNIITIELASAAFQIGIVLASATIITGMIALAWISGLLALAGHRLHRARPVRAASAASACEAVLAHLHQRGTGVDVECMRQRASCTLLRKRWISRSIRADQPLAVAAQRFLDARLDRIDQRGRLGPQRHDELIELLEPRHLQQLRPRHVEDEGGDADAEEFREHDGEDGAEPIFMGEQPEPDQLQRKQRNHRHDEHDQRHRRRQRIDALGEPLLEGAQRNPRHHPRHDRLEVIPQPGLDQEDDRKQNPERLKKAAHHRCCPRPASPGVDHIWMARLPTASAASLMASERVGWAWQVRARSSAEPPNSISTAASWIISPASRPTMCTPSTRSVFASARTFTKPSVVWLTLERPLAVNGNLPTV